MSEIASHIWVFDEVLSSDIMRRIVNSFDNHRKVIPSHVYNKSNSSARNGAVILLKNIDEDGMICELVEQKFRECALIACTSDGGLESLMDECIEWTAPRVERVGINGGFVWHMDSRQRGNDRRFLTGIIYLNDVSEGGELEFLRYNVMVKPKAGRLVLFPPYWTHAHRGKSPLSNAKYAIGIFASISSPDNDGEFIDTPDAYTALR